MKMNKTKNYKIRRRIQTTSLLTAYENIVTLKEIEKKFSKHSFFFFFTIFR